ncbi:MAG: R3H domain-containing nucleic acid-binding protein [Candidatus Daviesbacteria bacterium]|nr:R3H domain-containing nucleic acid-binding protein [Candidatus Daviesbacteria bacterium]
MENQLSEILDNLLGMLLLEGSYEIEEKDENFTVSIETKDAGRLIGARGESLDGLQTLVNQMVFRKMGEVPSQKRVVIDVEGWRKQKEEELASSAKSWGTQVLEDKKELELEPMSPWQRRIVHMVIAEMPGLSSESAGEGRDRHIVIKLETRNPKSETEEQNAEASGA